MRNHNRADEESTDEKIIIPDGGDADMNLGRQVPVVLTLGELQTINWALAKYRAEAKADGADPEQTNRITRTKDAMERAASKGVAKEPVGPGTHFNPDALEIDDGCGDLKSDVANAFWDAKNDDDVSMKISVGGRAGDDALITLRVSAVSDSGILGAGAFMSVAQARGVITRLQEAIAIMEASTADSEGGE